MQLKSYDHIYQIHKKSNVKRWFAFIFLAGFLVLFLPWTQNIKVQGTVTNPLSGSASAAAPFAHSRKNHQMVCGKTETMLRRVILFCNSRK